METSKGYQYLKEQLNAVGREKSEILDITALKALTTEERIYIEERIVNSFRGMHGDSRWADFMPLLENYDGINILRETLRAKNIPSIDSLIISIVLLKATDSLEYLNIVKQNIEMAGEKREDYISYVCYSKNGQILELLKDIYVSDSDERVRSIAIDGILYNYGVLKDIHDLKEYYNKIDIVRSFLTDDIEIRKNNIIKMDNQYGKR